MDTLAYYDEQAGNVAPAPATCGRCHGTGHFPQFAHIRGGACFNCNGSGLPRKAEAN